MTTETGISPLERAKVYLHVFGKRALDLAEQNTKRRPFWGHPSDEEKRFWQEVVNEIHRLEASHGAD